MLINMKVKVNYQGILVEKAGTVSETLPETGSSSLILERLMEKHPSLKDMNFVLAINGVIAHEKKEIKEGDNITLIPPAPGG